MVLCAGFVSWSAQATDDGAKLSRGLDALRAVAEKKATSADRLEAAYTTGYIAAAIDVIRTRQLACVPTLSDVENIDVVRTFLAQHRDMLESSSIEMIIHAFNNRYPCQ